MLLETSVALLLSLGSGSCFEVPEMKGVDIAGVMYNMDSGTKHETNNGKPNQFIKSGGKMYSRHKHAIMNGDMSQKDREEIMMPLRGPLGGPLPFGSERNSKMTMDEIDGVNFLLHNKSDQLKEI